MLESYDDTGGCVALVICLIGLIILAISMWNEYQPDNRRAECAYERVYGCAYERAYERACECACECTIECEHK